ncbi:MAG: SiaB family protein kinase [Opitutales bacterium]
MHLPPDDDAAPKPLEICDSRQLYRYYETLSHRDIILTFKGAMSQDTLVELGDLLALPDSESEVPSPSVVRKLFAILVEMAQNIFRYSSERMYLRTAQREVGVGLLVLKQTEDVYMLAGANRMSLEHIEGLTSRCDFINSLSVPDLRRYFNEERRKAREPGASGAGLGLIDIARRSGHPLTYSIHSINGSEAFFTLTATVDRSSRSADSALS